MRATISFDIDLEKVEDTMATLVSQEASTLLVTANILENVGHGPLLQEVTEAVDILNESVSQLRQYKDMLISFEQAKYNTMIPQSAPPELPLETTSRSVGEMVKNLRQAQDTLKNVGKFEEFVSRMSAADDTTEKGLSDDEPNSEG